MSISASLLAVAAAATVQFPEYDIQAYCDALSNSAIETIKQHASNCVSRQEQEKAVALEAFEREDRVYVREICLHQAEVANGSYSAMNFCFQATKPKQTGLKEVPEARNEAKN